MSEEHDDHPSYVKIWGILLVLLTISVLGPMLEIQVITLITAFGIACVKAFLVAKHFMHINLTAKFVPYLVMTGLLFMLLFFAGVAPDVMNAEGSNWTKPSWQDGGYRSPADEGAAAHH